MGQQGLFILDVADKMPDGTIALQLYHDKTKVGEPIVVHKHGVDPPLASNLTPGEILEDAVDAIFKAHPDLRFSIAAMKILEDFGISIHDATDEKTRTRLSRMTT